MFQGSLARLVDKLRWAVLRRARERREQDMGCSLCEKARHPNNVPDIQEEREDVAVDVTFNLSVPRDMHSQPMKQEFNQADHCEALSLASPHCPLADCAAVLHRLMNIIRVGGLRSRGRKGESRRRCRITQALQRHHLIQKNIFVTGGSQPHEDCQR